LDDVSSGARTLAIVPNSAGAHATVVKHGQWKAAVKAYLAFISFVDAQVGRLLDALDASPSAMNTVIVLWGDHGWHLGEKEHWGKWTGWERSTHTPLIIAPASAAPAAAFKRNDRCTEPVSLLDLYPTLIEFCGLPSLAGLSGQSLVPLLKNPATVTGRHVLTTFGKGNYSLTGARWHYIRYDDGAEELYDSVNDPHEWKNLAGKPAFQSIQQEMSKRLDAMIAAAPNSLLPSAQPAKQSGP
jgi:arylsulfatase A-like enzyme